MYGIVTQSRRPHRVESRPGGGTTFRIYLPGQPGRRSLDAGEGAAAPRTGRETMLVVEDESAVRSLARDVLTRLGYDVLVASDGREALKVQTGVADRSTCS